MIMKLVDQNNPILRQPAAAVDNVAEIQDLIKNLYDTLEVSHGVGLAAPQIGIGKQVFVIAIDGIKKTFINPVVLATSEQSVEDIEGCLSLPNLRLKVKRPPQIKAMWTNEQGEQEIADLDGLWARCWLHEYDHVNGILIDDRVSKLVLSIAKKKLAKKQKQTQRI
jgi:peptide deformylase